MDLPTLHGPDWPYYVIDYYGEPPKPRRRLVRPLTFNWVLTNGEWSQVWEAYLPIADPIPVPDYSPFELAKMEAAQTKRAKRAA